MQVSQMKYVKEFDGLRGLMAVWVLLGYWASTIETPFKLFKSAPVQPGSCDSIRHAIGFAIAAMLDNNAKPLTY
jgi:hypothetical protein